MAKSIEAVAENMSNLTGFDIDEFKKDLEEYNALVEQGANMNQKIAQKAKELDKQRGYDMKAFKQVATLMRKSPEGAAAYARTLLAGIRSVNMVPDTDLVDMMGEANG